MQSINLTAINPLFMAAFFGSTAVCAFLAVYSLLSRPQAAFYLLLGSLIYLVGFICDDCGVQRAAQQCSGPGRSRKHGRCETLDPLPHILVGLEPCADVVVDPGVGSVRLRTLAFHQGVIETVVRLKARLASETPRYHHLLRHRPDRHPRPGPKNHGRRS